MDIEYEIHVVLNGRTIGILNTRSVVEAADFVNKNYLIFDGLEFEDIPNLKYERVARINFKNYDEE